jgi:predicted SAM-dependent methyltransferase
VKLRSTRRATLFWIVLLVALSAATALAFDDTRSHLVVFYHQKVSDPRAIATYFHAHPVRKLQLGAGANHADGWLNTDIEPGRHGIYLDASSDYPFPAESFQYVFAEHLIEHLPWEGGLKMLQESHRVLAPGGKVRVITPDLERLVHLLNDGPDVDAQKFIDASRRLFNWPETPVMPAYILNKVVREWGHQFVYDPGTLRKTLELAGFTDIRQLRVGDTTDPVFAQVELRTRAVDEDMRLTNTWGAMVFEAMR